MEYYFIFSSSNLMKHGLIRVQLGKKILPSEILRQVLFPPRFTQLVKIGCM